MVTKFMKLKIIIEGKLYDVEVQEENESLKTEIGSLHSRIQSSVLPAARLPVSSDFTEDKVCRSPLAGLIYRVQVDPGQYVEAKQVLVILEAMKMEIKIPAERAGTIKSVEVAVGDTVKTSQVLVVFE